MKQILFSLLLSGILGVTGSFSLLADRISPDDAARLAERYLSAGKKMKGTAGADAKSAEVKDLVQTEAYYVFTSARSDAGFVIISADDALNPLVGYSEEGKFDSERLPAGLKAYLSDYSRIAEAVRSGKIQYRRTTLGGEAIAPLLKVKWNQSEPYDRLTPIIGDSHAPSGCVATAMAQVMKHFQFPPAGHGVAGEFTYNQSVTLGHPYEWGKMLDVYNYNSSGVPNYTEEQGDAVALLMRDAGYSVNMDYGYYESLAVSAAIPAALCRNFNYSTDLIFCERTSYSSQAWVDVIRSSLVAGSPVLYSGHDGKTGHEFVCDGIDTEDLLHINWGWGGYGDGYFDMNILSPEYLGIGAGNGAYYRDQDIVANIRPGNPDADNTAWRCPLTLSNPGLLCTVGEDGKIDQQEYVGISYHIINSTGAPVESDEYATALKITDDAGNVVGVYSPYRVGSFGIGYYYDRTQPVYFSTLISDGVLRDGHYVMGVAVIPYDRMYNNPTGADILPVYEGDLCSIGFTMRGGEIYLDNPRISLDYPVAPLKLNEVQIGGGEKIYAGSSVDCTLVVQNLSAVTFDESCSGYLIPVEEDSPEIDLGNYWGSWAKIFIYPGVEMRVSFPDLSVPDKPGTYRFYITDNKGRIIPSDKPVYAEVVTLPDNEAVMTTPLTLNRTSYPRSGYIYFDVDFRANNPFSRHNTEFELWAHRKGAPEDTEVLLIKSGSQRFANGSSSYNISGWSEADALWYSELGEYEAYIKFTDAGGSKKRLGGENNSALFVLTPCEDEYQALLTSPVVINQGHPVVAENWSTFDVDFEIMSPTGMTVIPGETYVDVCRGPRGDSWVYSFVVNRINFDKTELSPGESTKVHIEFLYRTVEGEEDLIGKTLYLFVNYFSTPYGYCRLQVGDYENSLSFRLVPQDAVEVTDIILNYPAFTGQPGMTFYLIPTIYPENATDQTMSWSSSDPDIAFVSDFGLVHLLSEGTAVITASCGKAYATCVVTVNDGSGVDEMPTDENSDVTVISTQGELVFKGRYADANLAPGVYIVRRADGSVTKIIK
ncbi:MAG: C10 family peptidase [Muribaculaceae bacterium]|nr:C10 family peptidase [Muribaculaceae bacterium]